MASSVVSVYNSFLQKWTEKLNFTAEKRAYITPLHFGNSDLQGQMQDVRSGALR